MKAPIAQSGALPAIGAFIGFHDQQRIKHNSDLGSGLI
jgi:hypothetical protein